MRFVPTWVGLLAAVLITVGCQGSFGDNPSHDNGSGADIAGDSPVPACPVDPDCAIGGDCSLYECPDYWICEDRITPAGTVKRCTNPGPAYPDGSGDWDCSDVDGRTVCRGSSFPDGGGDGAWNCEMTSEFVVCTSDSPSYPDEGGSGPWNCWYEDEFRICESGGGSPDGGGWTCFDTATGRECRRSDPEYPDDRDWACYDADGTTVCTGTGDLPDGGGGSGWNCESTGEFVICRDDSPDYPDGGGDGAWDCYHTDEFRVCEEDGGGGPGDGGGSICVPGVYRWCDDHTYCSWGKQTCLPDGRWGPCIEPDVDPVTGLGDRPNTACGCRYFYFNWDCCEDQADRDGDGNPDCIIPEDHTPPACTSDGSLCSYCDVHGDCGGATDMCLFARDGYAFCSEDCSTSSCSAGYSCQSIGTRTGTVHQCVPAGGTCE
jgi:hypothetical protein